MAGCAAVTLQAQFAVLEESLQIDYAIENRGSMPVYLLDRVLKVEPTGDTTVGQASPRIEFLPPDCAVISLKLFPIPPGTAMTVPPSVYARRLEPGAQVRDRLTVPQPLYEWRTFEREQGAEARCRAVRLVVGIVPESENVRRQEHVIAGESMWRLGAGAWDEQKELSIDREVSPEVRLRRAP